MSKFLYAIRKGELTRSEYAEEPYNQVSSLKPGDVVRLKTGCAPIKITRQHPDGNISGHYIKSAKRIECRPAQDFELYTASEAKQEELDMTNKLYKTLDGNRYGEYRAKDGNNILLFMSDTNTYEAFDPGAIKRVMPFTYDVIFSGTGTVYSYIGTDGEVAVGDLLLGDSMTIAQVVATNTESEKANKRFGGVKLVTTPLAK
jgi:hypothetical protein